MNTLSSGYRFGVWLWWKHWISPRTYWFYIKYKWQRANRGWADCDIWSLDCYLTSWLPDALKKLKADKHGIPASMFPDGPDYCDADGYSNDAGWDIATEKWSSILDAMIAGFEAKRRIDDNYHLHRLLNTPDKWLMENRQPTETTRKVYAEVNKLEEAERAVMEKGLLLFAEHFESLWD